MDSSACTSTSTGRAFLPKRQPSYERTGTQDDNVVFMTMPRPLWDFHREYGNDELEAMSEEINADVTTYSMKDPIDFPHWTWIISTSAYRQSRDLDEEFLKRDQDRLGMYIYNDFTGYGIQEVVENLVSCLYAEQPCLTSPNTRGFSFIPSQSSLRKLEAQRFFFGLIWRP